ncbi:MAG TPA: glycosyltransferase family 1 protein [Thermodesulfobacteriota bacterium]|nr:glycosyltransferase family 1 protein [Thermodesulfobacteriota bacterium]
MRIGINALYLLPGRVGGTEVYIRNLVKWLLKIDAENEYFIFINKESAGIFEEFSPRLNIVMCPIHAQRRPVRVLWEQIALPMQIKKRNIDLLLSAGMTAPFLCPARSVLVLYDLQHVNQPWNFPKVFLFFLKALIYLSAKTSDSIITISEKVKGDIVKHYGIPPERVHAIHIGIDTGSFFIRKPAELKPVMDKYRLPSRFILYPAASLPHKNHERLLEAFKTVKKEEKTLKLLLTGARDYGYEEIEKKIKELDLKDDVIFMGWLPHEDMPAIYCASTLLIFPSLHEGFGMPVIEAFASGVPVVCSDIEPLKEIAEGAALFIDPYNPESIAEGILKVLNDGKLRQELIKNGLERAKNFRWEVLAEKTLSVLNSSSGRL